MSLLSRFIRRFTNLAHTATRNPGRTAQSFYQAPSLVQGINFSQGTDFSTQLQADDDCLESANPLLSYFNAHTEGAGIWKWKHYFDIYQRHFSKFVGREVHVLEVGIYSGGSLTMWKEYFGNECRIYGVDIESACMAYKAERIEVFIGDQEDRSFWARVRQAVPKLDILIDDGGHHPEQQRITLEEMLPHLRPGGVYLCEDIQGTPHHFSSYLQGLASNLNAMAPAELPNGVGGVASTPSSLQQAINAIHLYPFVAVIEKRERSIRRFIAPKHGTQWQPFL
jgi:SAM-dependent methyltransferase